MTTHDTTPHDPRHTRGSLLRLAGLAAASGAGAAAWKVADADSAASGPLAVSSGLVACVLAPELTEGPFYVAREKLRRDITEGKAGVSLRLDLTVLNASSCRPIRNAAVDIWHCDALGAYSGAIAGNPGTNFLRGIQRTNAEGRGDVQDDLPGLVSGPRRPHPRQGARRRQRRPHRAAILPRGGLERGLQTQAVQQPRGDARHAQRRRLDLPQRRQQGAAQAAEGRRGLRRARSRWGSTSPEAAACRCKTASRRSASSSPTRRAGSSTGIAVVSTTTAGRIRRHYGVRRWISCRLEFKGWQRSRLLQPGKFTELFFLDEATALAAGHRPCALCRREDYNRFVARWTALHPADVGADAIDARLHEERFDVDTRQRRLHRVALDDVPDGAFVLQESAPRLVLGSRSPSLDAGRLRRGASAARAARTRR